MVNFAGVAAPLARAGWAEGDVVPDFAEFGVNGNLPALKGKVTYVDFWASWCGPCKLSFPALDALQRKYAERGFQVVAISVDENEKSMQRFLERLDPSFATGRDAEQRLAENAGLEVMPSSFLVDVDGKIRSAHRGWKGERSAEELETEIVKLLQEAGK